jgi:hypothetical protein
MSAWEALEDLIEALRAATPGDLVDGRVSLTRPASGDPLPAVVVAAEDVAEQSAGVGRLVGNAAPDGGPTTTSRCSGRLRSELWAADEPAMTQLAEAVMAALAPAGGAAARRRFHRLAVRAFGPIEHAPLTPDAGDALLRMSISCSFTHETPPTAEADSEHVIRTIRVELENGVEELVDLSAAPPKPNPVLNPTP